MKKPNFGLPAGLSSTLSNINNAVAAVKSTMGPTSSSGGEAHSEAAPASGPASDKQYLRLPIESARKLRWFDKGDVSAIVKTHVREKRELLDAVTALKKLLIRAGFSEATLDVETRQLLLQVDSLRESDEGVASTLLVSAQCELEAMQGRIAGLEAELAAARAAGRGAAGEAGSPLALPVSSHAGFQDGQAGQPGEEVDQQSSQSSPSASASASGAAHGGVGQHAAAAADGAAAMAAAAAALESSNPVVLRQAGEELRAQARAAEERARAAAAATESLRAELAEARKALEAVRGKTAAAEQLRRYQDICVEAEERASVAERRASLLEARLAKAEAALRDAGAEARALGKQLAAEQEENDKLQRRVCELESAALGTSAAAEASGGARREAEAAALERSRVLEEEASGLRRRLADAAQQAAALEKRCQQAEALEAAAAAELREAEAVAAARDALEAEVAALRDRLDELRAERAALEHYKQVAAENDAARMRAEADLVATSQLATSLEGRLRAAYARAEEADLAAQLAEGRAQGAEQAVAAEVTARMAAIGGNRALWPEQAREELAQLNQRVDALQSALSAAQAELDAGSKAYGAECRARAEAQRALAEAEDRLGRAEREAAQRARELEHMLDYAQKDADGCREAAFRLEREKEELVAQLQQRAGRGGRVAAALGVGGPGTPQSSGSQAKWQVQNNVGGGSLYGVADGAAAGGTPTAAAPVSPRSSSGLASREGTPWGQAAGGGGGGSGSGRTSGGSSSALAAPRDKMSGIDVVYLKNVVLKFVEAVLAGKVTERDALLPAIATLLQASAAEYKVLKKVAQNTQPPAAQVWSVLGSLASTSISALSMPGMGGSAASPAAANNGTSKPP